MCLLLPRIPSIPPRQQMLKAAADVEAKAKEEAETNAAAEASQAEAEAKVAAEAKVGVGWGGVGGGGWATGVHLLHSSMLSCARGVTVYHYLFVVLVYRHRQPTVHTS